MAQQRWLLEADGHAHVVEIDDAGLGRRIVWRRDDQELTVERTGDERVQLIPHDAAPAGVGAVGLRFAPFGPARRVTLYAGEPAEATAAALLGVGGLDFVPEPGSRAAWREEWIHSHPRLYTARRTATAIGAVVGGLLVAWALSRIVLSVDLPRIPSPDLPDIPWPDVPWPEPAIPWPGWAIPGWVRETAGTAKLLVPVVIAYAVARGEIRRRRHQEEKRVQGR